MNHEHFRSLSLSSNQDEHRNRERYPADMDKKPFGRVNQIDCTFTGSISMDKINFNSIESHLLYGRE